MEEVAYLPLPDQFGSKDLPVPGEYAVPYRGFRRQRRHRYDTAVPRGPALTHLRALPGGNGVPVSSQHPGSVDGLILWEAYLYGGYPRYRCHPGLRFAKPERGG